MSYPIDVYQKKIKPTRDIISVLAFMTFLPQLLAGPIERADRMIPQFQQPRIVDRYMLGAGVYLILIGLFKKIAIADSLSNEVNNVFSNIEITPWPELIGGLLLYTIQIYCDFSGYSDIARGIGYLFGIHLTINFNQPYFSQNISEFWRRWHITLSTWLRDYIYIPLGGSRVNRMKHLRNLLITMTLCGIWHGANWTFIIWGFLHGIYLCCHQLLSKKIERISKSFTSQKAIKFCNTILTFILVAFAWLFFRVSCLSEAFVYIKRIFLCQGTNDDFLFYCAHIIFYIALVLFIDIPQYLSNDHTVMLKWPWQKQGLFCSVILILIILLAPGNEIPFIYFQF